MGWGIGSVLFLEVWETVRPHISEDKRIEICAKIMDCFESYDCDTICDLFDEGRPEIEAAYNILNP